MAADQEVWSVHRYKHFKPGEETNLWREWLKRHGHQYDKFDYDVHVGKGTPAPKEYNEKVRKGWERLTQKRIDVIVWQNGAPTLIEVKLRASLAALGQLTGYQFLWNIDHPSTPSYRLLLISKICDEDILTVAKGWDVEVEVISSF